MSTRPSRPSASYRLKAFAAYVKRNRSFLGRVFKQYAWNTVHVRILRRTRVIEPLSAIFYVTHRCNLACHYCTQKYPDVSSQEVSTDQTVELLRILRPRVGSLYITGGEPLCRSDLEEILEAAAGLRYSTILRTNGVLLDRREKLLDYISSLVISLDSVNEGRFDSITQSAPGTTRRIISNIACYGRLMQETRRPITLNCVISARNLDDVYDVMEFCREHGFTFSCCSALKNDLTPYELASNTRYQRLVGHILESKRQKRLKINGSLEELEYILKSKDFNCYPTLFARIYPDGDVYYPCVPLKTVGAICSKRLRLKKSIGGRGKGSATFRTAAAAAIFTATLPRTSMCTASGIWHESSGKGACSDCRFTIDNYRLAEEKAKIGYGVKSTISSHKSAIHFQGVAAEARAVNYAFAFTF